MKRILVLTLVALCLGSALSGCIVVPDGDGYHHHRHYDDRY
ncbi:hypothetical protein ACFPTO_17315 [Paraburkholderia denitrificans]|uniref:Lipoprotein n=1 Tax=Paraburkholderia denitrificans TaxID=694025 RepID=A0ABW0JBP3_9BURK